MPPDPIPEDVLIWLRRIFSSHPDPVRMVRRDGEVLFRNVAAQETVPDGLGHLCREDRRGRDLTCPACRLGQTLREGSHQRWHVVVPPSSEHDPKTYYEITHCPILDAEGKPAAVIEVLRDATIALGVEQYLIDTAESLESEVGRRTDEAGRLRERADSLGAELGALRTAQSELVYRDRLVALGHLVAGLAHEIRTPLGAVVSSADVTRRQLARLRDEPDPASATDRIAAALASLDVVNDGAQRILGVVRSLQLFSRLDEARRKEVDLHEGLDSTIALLGCRMGDAVEIVREYGEIPRVPCRPDAINQVFMNLLLNAIQAVEPRGSIRIRTYRDGPAVAVTVTDSGPGIPADVLPRVFDLGFTTKGPGRGSGIGLALSRVVLEEHGGSIDVVSEPGRGASVTVRLPLVAAEEDR